MNLTGTSLLGLLSKEKFSYLIAGKEYTIDDIVYGLIRKRKPKATSGSKAGSKTPSKQPGEVALKFLSDQRLIK